MAFYKGDRVKETTASTGTGTIELGGAVSGFQSFLDVVPTGNTTYYAIIVDEGDWEVGIGTVTSGTPNTLSRDTVLSSSNAGSLVSFAAGTKSVLGTLPADKAVVFDDSGNVNLSGDLTVDTDTLKVDSTNNRVGIGTTSPSYPLDIAGASAGIRIDNTAGTPDQTLMLFQADMGTNDRNFIIKSPSTDSATEPFRFTTGNSFAFEIDSNPSLVIDSSGNVGIGTSSPSYPLQISKDGGGASVRLDVVNTGVAANDDTILSFVSGSNNNENIIYFGDTDDINVGIIRYDHATDSMEFTTNASEAVRIDSSGNVGIGTSSPSGKLHVQDNTGSLSATNDITAEFRRADGTNNPRLQIRHSTTGSDINHTYSSTAPNLTFSIANNERMRIDSSGNVGIGTTSPSSPLTVNGYIESTTNGFKFPDASIQTTDGVTEVKITYLTSGTAATFTPQTNTRYTQVICTGGGGGGGGADGDGASGSAGGGGGAGGTAIRLYNSTEMGANATYTIGGGGTGGSTAGGNGTAGSASSFDPAGTGSTLTANGGSAGTGTGLQAAANNGFSGGAGGSASGGQLNESGGAGGFGIGFTGPDCHGGAGGVALWAGSGKGASNANTQAGSAANSNTGAGGGGAIAGGSTTGSVGGAGASGVIQIIEYIYN